MSDDRHAVIAGAGIGGLTAALALARKDYRVSLLEKEETPSEAGAGIQIGPNAGKVLEQLGLGDAMRDAAIEPPAIRLRGGLSGNLDIRIDTSVFRERYDYPHRVIHRGDLYRILMDAARATPGIDLRLGAPASSFQQEGDGITVNLESGETIDGAVLVVADGIRSALRAGISPSTKALPTGHSVWRTLLPIDDAPPVLNVEDVCLWLGPEGHFVHYPVRGGSMVNLVATVEERWDHNGWNAPAEQSDLLRRFADWPLPVRDAISSARGWRKYSVGSVDPNGTWTAGRATLLGDAAHAMPPYLAQGGAMAIEDAATLAQALGSADSVENALRAYEAARRPRVTRLAEASRKAGDIYEAPDWLAAARDIALFAGRSKLVIRRNDWIYRWTPENFQAQL